MPPMSSEKFRSRSGAVRPIRPRGRAAGTGGLTSGEGGAALIERWSPFGPGGTPRAGHESGIDRRNPGTNAPFAPDFRPGAERLGAGRSEVLWTGASPGAHRVTWALGPEACG